jgi:hypothetical protein
MNIHVLNYFIIFKVHYISLIYVLKFNVKNYHFTCLFYVGIYCIKNQSLIFHYKKYTIAWLNNHLKKI